MLKSYLQLNERDNVAVALRRLNPEENGGDLAVVDEIEPGHKFALRSISVGEHVVKYGASIGVASCPIGRGEHVHAHNLKSALGRSEFPGWQTPPTRELSKCETTFEGYLRSEGRVAIRNEIWIINTVACVNQTANRLAERANASIAPGLENVDGFFAFPHPYGCSQLGDDLSDTQKILAGLINHPHAGGVLVLGLGCENNRLESQLKMVQGDKMSEVVFFNTQDVGDEMADGMQALETLSRRVNQSCRQSLATSRLVLGMKCGGSDGLSGITANPLLGRIADRHTAEGGTVLLTEVPEMFGAEGQLLSRCDSAETHRDLCVTIEGFKDYFRRHGQPISENPSPGNREGGITTLEEKSLGCVQKGGADSWVKQVVAYGDCARSGLSGLALINGPGNDGVSTTALTAAGANIVLFTTGRGTPLGSPVPTLKVSTNSELARNKPGWIDFDAGQMVEGGRTIEELADELYGLIVSLASGQCQTKNEINGYREIAIWKTGVTL